VFKVNQFTSASFQSAFRPVKARRPPAGTGRRADEIIEVEPKKSVPAIQCSLGQTERDVPVTPSILRDVQKYLADLPQCFYEQKNSLIVPPWYIYRPK